MLNKIIHPTPYVTGNSDVTVCPVPKRSRAPAPPSILKAGADVGDGDETLPGWWLSPTPLKNMKVL